MKFIGQYIQSFIARFRNDIYLEDVDTGTIASGGNLGLDSNNKIVKATLSSGGISHDGSTANGVLTFKDADEATVESNLTFDGSNLSVISASEAEPVLTLKTTHTTANKSGELQFLKDAADTEDGEALGLITFYGEDEGNNNTRFAQIKGAISESDEGAEGGKLLFAVASHDAELQNGLQLIDGDAEDEVDVTIASGTSSTTTVSGDLVVTTGLILDSVDVTAIQTSGESFADNDTSIMTSAAIDDKINTKYSTSYITFSVKTSSTHGTNYVLLHGNGISGGLVSIDSGTDSAGDFGGVTTEEGGSGTDATCTIQTGNLEQQIPIPETCKLMGFYATTTTTTNTGAAYDTGVAIWHVPEANVNWGASTAGTATLIHKSDSSLHAENTAHSGTNRKKVQKVERMSGTAKNLAAGDIIIPSVFGETADQQITATITLVIATPIKTIA